MRGKIIGNGMIARAFESYQVKGDVLIICSGVSNSHETREIEFERELNLIKELSSKNKKKITFYFSSIMVDSGDSAYYKHKKNVEELIKSKFECYWILRLPQVVGLCNNNTIFPFFVRSIYEGRELVIQKNATRALIDVDDVVRLVNCIIPIKKACRTISICPPNGISVINLAQLIGKELGRIPLYKVIEGGVDQRCDAKDIKEIVSEGDVIFNDDYLDVVIKKYAKKIVGWNSYVTNSGIA